MSRSPFRSCLPLLPCLLLSGGIVGAGEPEPRLRLLVPAYFYPAGDGLKHWDRLIASAKQAPILAIANPASGPGDKADPAYTRILDRARKQKGRTLLGYVTTGYGKRPIADVKADVDRWTRLYPQVQGIFFDEQASGADRIDYYAALYGYARTERKLQPIVTNPGTVCAEDYVARPASDIVCLFEGFDGFAKFRPPEWTAKYKAARFAFLRYQAADAGQMRQSLADALEKRIGTVYVTDATGANPWDRLPGYWDEELAAVAKANERKSR
jgi:hypothetical protein